MSSFKSRRHALKLGLIGLPLALNGSARLAMATKNSVDLPFNARGADLPAFCRAKVTANERLASL
jgi:hypothetical protein